ncbi:MAG: hypothetical protein HY562_09755 [Ignavibacteriales bacterium]|nr:hypothetical protein [Ignavibacteriales bacterium]
MQMLFRSNPQIAAFASRVVGDGLISFRENSLGAVIFGIDPEAEQKVSKFALRVATGRFLSKEREGEIVLGHKLFENLKAAVGDTLVILSQGFDGSLGNLKFKVVGAVKSGLGDFDRGLVLMNLADA